MRQACRRADLGGIYTTIGQPGRSIELFREMLASDEDPYALTASGLVFSLMRSGARAEAMVVAKDGRWEAFWPCFGEQTATGPGSSHTRVGRLS